MNDLHRKAWFALWGTLFLLGMSLPLRAIEGASGAVEFFESRIRPVLAQECYECHSTAGKRKGGLALDCRAGLQQGGDSGPVIVPGDPAKSRLIQAIRHEHEERQMPKGRAKLEAAVIADFAAWVRQGAPDPREAPPTEAQLAADTDWDAVMKRRKNWWSFQPIQKVDLGGLPVVSGMSHPVDRLLGVRLAAAGLPPAARADRTTLIRRLSYALRGLPPTPEEITAFVQEANDQAYEKLVDAYLASPRFGERWARHWMDWVRYADSHGSEGDPLIPYAWRYRDYLIRALNADVPYDQLVREHLAGDLLPRPRLNRELGLNESALGIGHLRMVFHGFAPTDALDEQVRFTDDQISVVSKAFLGLTVSCARCHNHKFDPISQKDFYGWYGIFVSCPPAAIAVDAPDAADAGHHAALADQKRELQAALAAVWGRDAESVTQKLGQPDETWQKVIAAAKDEDSLLHPFFVLRNAEGKTDPSAALAAWVQTKMAPTSANRTNVKAWNLAQPADYATWRHDGPGVQGVSPTGSFAVGPDGDRIITGIYPAGVYSHLLSTKDRGVLLSPRFQLDEKYDLWLRIAGDGGAVARYVVQNYPRDGSVFPVDRLGGGHWQWRKLGLDYWQGDRIHVEITTAADQPVLADVNTTRSWFGVSAVVITRAGEPGPAGEWPFAGALAGTFGPQVITNALVLAAGYAAALRTALAAWTNGANLTDTQALFLDQMLQLGLLRNQLAELPDLQPLVAAYRREEAAIRVPTRAQGVIETEPVDQPLFARGNHKQPGDPVPRRFLDAIDASPYPGNVSGRMQLAEDLLRADNPLTARVIVNRVWHHLFGRGIVATPDNFGRMGQEPSHPELLDYLAGWFVDHGYSIKSLIRYLVLTEAWQRSSDVPAGARDRDPNNLLLSHFNVRRLEAEAVRDALLAVSGDLRSDEMYGPPINGRTPRRSVYVRVKRNELDPFLGAFDAPVPASTTGKRDVTNVPGQSLTLLNDPFVLELAEHWARQDDRDAAPNDPAPRIAEMFVRSLGRPPTSNETARAEQFLAWTAGERTSAKAGRAQLEAVLTNAVIQMAALREAATARVMANRKATNAAAVAVVVPEPLLAWNFAQGINAQSGLAGQALGQARIQDGGLVLDGKSSYVASAPLPQTLQAKTLEAVVQLDNLNQQGGGVMSVQDLSGNVFDAIVYGENRAQHWMAGSEFYKRTQELEGAAEMEAKNQPVHLAIVYAVDGLISLYRNGQPYGKTYASGGPVTFAAGQAQVLFGNRHGDPGGNKCLAGEILRARLYDHALTAAEVQTLAGTEANTLSEAELLPTLTESERALQTDLQKQSAAAETQLKALNQVAGLSSAWADLAHALFNLKEFIFIR